MSAGPHISNYSGVHFPAEVPWALFEYGIVESPWKTTLLQSYQFASINPELFASGLFFGKRAELRWKRRRSGKFHLVLIGEEGVAPLDPVAALLLKPLKAESYGLPEQIFLWGEPHGSPAAAQWYEGRIPRLIQEYPKHFSGSRVLARLAHYIMEGSAPLPGGYSESCSSVVSRTVGLEGAKEP